MTIATTIMILGVVIAYPLLYLRNRRYGKEYWMITFTGGLYSLNLVVGGLYFSTSRFNDQLDGFGQGALITGMVLAVLVKLQFGYQDRCDKLAIRLAVVSSVAVATTAWQIIGPRSTLQTLINLITLLASYIVLVQLGRLLWHEHVTPSATH